MVNLNVRIPDEIHKAIKEQSQRNMRSLNSEIVFAMIFYLRSLGIQVEQPKEIEKRDL